MEELIRPDESDCCGSGCNPCILDVYEAEKNKQLNKTTSTTECMNVLSPIKYTKFSVAFIERVHTYLLITFYYSAESVLHHEKENVISYCPGQYFIIRSCLENDEKSHFTRPYTPLKSLIPISFTSKITKEKCLKPYFQIIVKIYENGLMSEYLKNLQVGDVTMWRGPYGDYRYKINAYKDIFMICQGTAIAPMLAIINEILNNDEDETKIMLNYCCKSLNDVMFRNELYSMRQFWNFTYKIFLSVPTNDDLFKYKEPLINNKLKFEDIVSHLENKTRVQILIAGSEMFMSDIENTVKKLDKNGNNVVLFR